MKPGGSLTDHHLMVPWSDVVWVLSGLCVAAAALTVTHVLAARVQYERKIHDLRVRVNTLRNQQFQQFQQFARKKQQTNEADFEIVEDEQEAEPDLNASQGNKDGHSSSAA